MKNKIIVDSSEWMSAAFDAWLKPSTEVLHWICPVCPDWTHLNDRFHDMQDSMECHWACTSSLGIILVIKSILNHQYLEVA